jgi:hypothetical protein
VKVGVLQFFGWRDRSVPLEDVYARALDRISVMDETGYDAVWLAEHHFTGYSVCPSVHVMAAHVAGRTRNLRIGTAVTLAAFYHPLRIAEEIALLDVLTGGRINWGAGRGFDPREFAIFGVPSAESADRFREAVARSSSRPGPRTSSTSRDASTATTAWRCCPSLGRSRIRPPGWRPPLPARSRGRRVAVSTS